MGAVDTLIVWENLDITRYVLKNHSTDGMLLIIYWGKNSEGPAENSWVLDLQQNENKFQKVCSPIHNRLYPGDHDDHQNHSTIDSQYIIIIC
jgi:hypothetical protein